jgi:hypothetical protein
MERKGRGAALRERCREHGAEKSRPEQTDTQSRPGQTHRPDQTRADQTRHTARITAPAGIKLLCISSVPRASQSVGIEPVD